MDYPKSLPGVGLVNGKFVDENPVVGTPGSLVPASWGNAVTQEILGVITAAGLTPAEGSNAQLVTAINSLMVQPAVGGGRLIGVRNFQQSDIYIPSPNTTSVVVEVVGGGGGGGSCPATDATQLAVSGGGGGGAYVRSYLKGGFAGVLVTVGAAGVGGVAGATGGAGGTSSFGTALSATGGSGGRGASPSSNAAFITTGNSYGGAPFGGNLINSPGAGSVPAIQLGGHLASGVGGVDGCGTKSGGNGTQIDSSKPSAPGQSGQPGRVTIYEFS